MPILRSRTLHLFQILTLIAYCFEAKAEGTDSRPNIVFILLDDMGYGDPGCFNPESRIRTPNIDGLAAKGVRFTDAHAAGSVCVPSRFGFLTGMTPLASRGYAQNGLIRRATPTIASVLNGAGYKTAMIGKWHNGFWNWNDQSAIVPKRLEGGPLGCGFETYFGIPHSLDIAPYLYIQDDRAVVPPSELIEASNSSQANWRPIQGEFWRKGMIAPGFDHADVVEIFTAKVLAWLEAQSRTGNPHPYFLYVALASPHTPWLPSLDFAGKSEVDAYGDFLMQTDHCVGRIVRAIEQTGAAANTLICLASDNGPVWFPQDVEKYRHDSAGGFRGMKGDVFEAGHRVPFIACWPDVIPSGSTSDEPICLTDMMRTFANFAGVEIPAHVAQDSHNIAALMKGDKTSPRDLMVHVGSKAIGIRQGRYKYIDSPTSGGFTEVLVAADSPPAQLYDLHADPGELHNLYVSAPEKVKELKQLLDTVRLR